MSNIPTESRTFDRLPQFDERSRSFPIRALVSPEPVSKVWRWGPILDQGQEGACVGFGWSAELGAEPLQIGVNNDFARSIYREAQKVDEWPGEDYEGSSVLAGAKVLTTMGYMAEYRWAFGIDDLRLALGHHGPAVVGTAWMSGMDPKPNGVVSATGSSLGGHCWMVFGVLLDYTFPGEGTDEWYLAQNSWGADWGDNGLFYLRRRDMAALLEQQGEACIPVTRTSPTTS